MPTRDRSPFHTVHLTGLVRDAEGQKMSKTKGNVLDPTDLVAEYGADAVRFTLSILDAPGRDIPLDPERMAGYRAFGNKIWNAARFALSRVGDSARVREEIDTAGLAAPERWILSRLARTAAVVEDRLSAYRFDEACNRLYHFFWGELCDWYIELAKPALFGDVGEDERPRVGDVLLSVLDRALRLLHPVMPFLTEEVWQRLPGREVIHPETISLAPYPEALDGWLDDQVEARMGGLMELVTRVRGLTVELAVQRDQQAILFLDAEDAGLREFVEAQGSVVTALTRAQVEMGPAPDQASRDLVAGIAFGLLPEEREIGDEERERLRAELESLDAEIGRARGRLSNAQFLAKAPDHVVEGNRARLAELEERRERIVSGLEG
jgi:valyl-tRNA synthetase